MFSTVFKTFASKPLAANPILKSTFLASKAPFQAAVLQRSFARHAPQRPHTANTTSQTKEEIFHPEKEFVPKGPVVDQIIREDVDLNNFMSKIYRTTGLSIAGSLSFSYLLATTSVTVAMNPFVAVLGGLALSIGGIVAMNKIPPQIKIENIGNKTTETWVNPPSRQLAFSTIIAGSSVMLAPFIQGLCMINPGIIPMAAGLSIFTMGGASLYAMYKPLGHFKAWESTMYSALIGMIGMNVLSLILSAAIGPNIFSMACGRVDMYVGLGLFAAFQALDTQVAVQAYKEGNYDHLMHVVNFFLNFKNIFIRIASIMGNMRD